MYNILLYVLKDRNNFYRYKKYIKEHVVGSDFYLLVNSIDEYFTKNTTISEIDFNTFISWFKFSKTASLSKEKHSIYNKIFDNVLTSTPSDDDINNTLEHFITMDYCTRIANYTLSINEGDTTKSILDLEEVIEEYKKESSAADIRSSIFVDDDFDDIISNHTRVGLEWRLEELNRSLGPIRQGDFIVVTSRPDSGKTTFLCSEATYMAEQLEDDQDVIWFNNEETRKKVKQRIWQAALGWTKEDMHHNKIDAKNQILKLFKRLDKIQVVDDKALDVHKIERTLANCNPGLIIFDQLFKVHGFKDAFSETDRESRLFGWARELADKYAPVINVHQADGSASGVAYIQMNQLHNSKTGIQGEADAIIGIGRTFDGDPDTRYIHVSKNKLDGGPRSIPLERNGKYEVKILPELARYESIAKWT